MRYDDEITLKLNGYQASNLVWLFEQVLNGCQEPLAVANSGDWTAEVLYLLQNAEADSSLANLPPLCDPLL